MDTLRHGISTGEPGSSQRIADLAKYYALPENEDGSPWSTSPFDDLVAMPYAREHVLAYNHQHIDACRYSVFSGRERYVPNSPMNPDY